MDLARFERQAGLSTAAIFISYKQRDDLRWSQAQLEWLPEDIATTLFIDYLSKYKRGERSERSANIWLRTRCESMRKILKRFPVPLFHMSTETRRAALAREWADRCQQLLHKLTDYGHKQVDARELITTVRQPADQWGICPALPSFDNYLQRKERGDYERDPRFYNAVCGAICRLIDDKWWIRQLERMWRRYQEHAGIIVGKVRSGVSPYISNKSLRDYKARKQLAQAWLNGNFVINREHDLELLLADAVAASVANPVNRRNELMVRMRGFEEYAKDHDYVGEFYTWTAPSKYHSYTKSKKGPSHANKRYQGASPRATQRYLCRQWAKCRAKLAREEVAFFGFRVVEPHHDGTPHWHLLLFVKPEQLRLLRSIMRSYALQHDKAELAPPKGKRGNNFQSYRPRFDFKTIDPDRGSATGYIAKYIAKNIDGAYVDSDYEAESSGIHGAEGVAAWASIWGIRQFQQIGGPSVTAWRELRRIREPLDSKDILETIRRTADNADWQRFIETMGGACLPRAERPVKLMKAIEKEANQYGEDITRLRGVMSDTLGTVTRLEGWEISRQGLGQTDGAAVALEQGASRAAWCSDNNCTQGSNTPKKDQRLIAELKKLGVDPCDLALLRQGAVINSEGSLIRLRRSAQNGAEMLIVSRESDATAEGNSDFHDMDAITEAAQQQYLKEQRQRLRREAWQLMGANTAADQAYDVEDWINNQSTIELSQLAIEQLSDVLELERIETAMHNKRQRQQTQQQYWEDVEDYADF